MMLLKKILRGIAMLSLFFSLKVCAIPLPIQTPHILVENEDFKATLIGLIRNESESDIYTTLLRHNIHDKLFYNRTTTDITLCAKTDTATFQSMIRNRYVWGNHKTVNTDRTYLVTLDALPTVHAHTFGPNMPWFREVWMQADMARLCGTDLAALNITLGSFSFKLGRGISLGDAYRVNSLAIDFFQDSVVDQFPWGAKASGTFFKELFSYDIYVGILDNWTTDLEETELPTRVATFGTSNTSKVRGDGLMRTLIAAHCLCVPMRQERQRLTFDPYIMHFADPEQRVRNLYDAKMSLTTIGFAVELVTQKFELGFDCANNFGHQYVKGWDNNAVKNVDARGYSAYYYTNIVKVDPTIQEVKASDFVLFDPENSAQITAIAQVTPGGVSNGQPIAGTPFYNSLTRYRDPYTTKLKGYMWVGDASFWLIPRNLVLSTTWGLASGDANPNGIDDDPLGGAVDKTYNGFVPVQELYAGKRVQSYFYMTSGLTPLLSSNNIDSYFTYAVDALSNVIFWGASIKYQPENALRKWSIMPNIIMYWSDYVGKKFDLSKNASTNEDASRFKGFETNFFLTTQISENTSLVGGIAAIVPGDYYFDVLGMPLSANARAIVREALKTGESLNNIPLLGDQTAYSGVVALLYTF